MDHKKSCMNIEPSAVLSTYFEALTRGPGPSKTS